MYWRFYQDGNIECEVRATGILVTSYFADGRQPPFGTLVDQLTYAPFHQHFIVARLDLDVDGQANTVYAAQSEALQAGPGDPYGLGLVVRETPLRTEADGQQDYDWRTQKSWKIVNDNVRNGLGTPVGYKLVPGGSFPALLDPSSPVLRRAAVIGHTLWVTPYRPDERWPCGEFPNLSEADSGLAQWTAQDRSIDNTDVVLWYVFGIHHITRPEDWPVMPVDTVSFWLKPFGFFDRNPALDVPPAARTAPPNPATPKIPPAFHDHGSLLGSGHHQITMIMESLRAGDGQPLWASRVLLRGGQVAAGRGSSWTRAAVTAASAASATRLAANAWANAPWPSAPKNTTPITAIISAPPTCLPVANSLGAACPVFRPRWPGRVAASRTRTECSCAEPSRRP